MKLSQLEKLFFGINQRTIEVVTHVLLLKLFLSLFKLALHKACWAKTGSHCISSGLQAKIKTSRCPVVLEDIFVHSEDYVYKFMEWVQTCKRKGAKVLAQRVPTYTPNLSCLHSQLYNLAFCERWHCIIKLPIKASLFRSPRKTFRGVLIS